LIFYFLQLSQSPDIAILGRLTGGLSEDFSATKDLRRAFSLLFLLSFIACSFCHCAAYGYTIEGKIEHVEQLPAVERRFSPGVQFDQTVELSPNNLWVKIPTWLAGSWSAREETAVFYQDFRNGESRNLQQTFKAKQDFNYGQQIDKSGQVWHYVGVPYTSNTLRSTAREIHEVREKQFLRANQDEVAFRAIATVLLVDSLSSRIERTYQQESLTTYAPIADDRISMTASTKVFNAGGRPQTLQKNEAIIKRYKRFQIINEKDGKDLKMLFREYMAAKGMADLLPDESEAESRRGARGGARPSFGAETREETKIYSRPETKIAPRPQSQPDAF